MVLSMKKLLGIIFLGLLLGGCATPLATNTSIKDILALGTDKETMCKSRYFETKEFKNGWQAVCHSRWEKNYQYLPEHNTEIIWNGETRVYFIYENVKTPMTCTNMWCQYGDGRLKKIVFSMDQAQTYANPKLAKAEEERILREKKKREEEIKIAEKENKEKPKKEKPKATPDNDKIVPAGSGSGFFVSSDGHIITNYHVIEGCNVTKVTFKGNQLNTQVIAVDKMNDIAILKTNVKPNSIFSISNEDVSLLEDVIVAGYPLGRQVSSAIKTHKGVVTALAGAGDNYSNFQTDATINAGNSGGPIMNQKGNVVGIAVQTWIEEGVQGIHFGIKSSTLKTFANSNSLKFTQANSRELSNKDLGKLITEATVYLECHMTIAKIKKMIAAADNRKAFFSEYR